MFVLLVLLVFYLGIIIVCGKEHHHKTFSTEVHHDNYKYISERTKGIFRWRFGRQHKAFSHALEHGVHPFHSHLTIVVLPILR